MASSISSTIKQAILTDSPSDVTIYEKSLVSELLTHQHRGEPLTLKMVFSGNPLKSKRLIIAHTILYILRCFILGIIWAIYALYEVLYKLLTGKSRNMRPSIGINLVLFSGTLIVTIIVLIFTITFLVKNVILAPNEASVNSNGVISINQPCMVTQYFYLLNAATYWTSSGIYVSRGDRIYISVSGGMYSDIGEMSKKAASNEKLQYQRSVFSEKEKDDTTGIINKIQQCLRSVFSEKEKDDTTGIKYCIYNNDDIKNKKDPARFGSLLCMIASDMQNPELYISNGHPAAIHQIDYEKNEITFEARENECGILYFTFNDILLDSSTFHSIMNDSNDAAHIMRVDLLKTKKYVYDSIEDPTIWFKDNLGEALVNIRIERSICHSSIPFPEKIAMAFYRKISRMETGIFRQSTITVIIITIVSSIIIVLFILLLCDVGITHLLNRIIKRSDSKTK